MQELHCHISNRPIRSMQIMHTDSLGNIQDQATKMIPLSSNVQKYHTITSTITLESGFYINS